MKTKRGVTGLGDASQSSNSQASLGYLKQFFALLKARSIADIEWFRAVTLPVVRQHGVAASVAASALEQCLWDIQGKIFGVPTYDLFGGRTRERIPVYANINRSTLPRTPEEFAAMADRAIRDSFNSIKLAPFDEMPKGLKDETRIEEFMKAGVASALAVREAIGTQKDLLIDVHSHFNRQ